MERARIIAAIAARGFNVTEENFLRHVRIAPYIEGKGPAFDLLVWDTPRRYSTGQWKVGYALIEGDNPDPIFCGEDCGVAPMDPVDSDAALRGVLGWLTLRPGDTDAEYFDTYNARQHAFAATHAETLGIWGCEESYFDGSEEGPPAFDNVDENGNVEPSADSVE